MTQYPYPQQPFQPYVPRLVCPQCGTELSPALLSCPKCHRLVHSERLNQLAAEAKGATEAGDVSTALARWREALTLLPRESKQHGAVEARVNELSARVDAPDAGTKAKPRAAGGTNKSLLGKIAGGVGAGVLLLATKGKLLLLGLTKASTFFSMIAAGLVYWQVWGWKFAVGIVVCTYVHEMGHIAMLQRYGMKTTAPMFIPGLGAFILLKQHPANPREDARMGLAGPTWGLCADVVAYAVSLATGWPSWAAIAKFDAWINLFNLLPVWQLDGSRGFRALSTVQRLVVVAVMGIMAYVAWDGMLALIAAVGAMRALGETKDAPREGDRLAFGQFVFLVVALALMSEIRVPGVAHH